MGSNASRFVEEESTPDTEEEEIPDNNTSDNNDPLRSYNEGPYNLKLTNLKGKYYNLEINISKKGKKHGFKVYALDFERTIGIIKEYEIQTLLICLNEPIETLSLHFPCIIDFNVKLTIRGCPNSSTL
jgi:hypothetical protein